MSLASALASPVSISTNAVQAPRKRGMMPTPVNLLRLAKAADGFASKKQAREALQYDGFISTPAVVQELLAAAAYIENAHKNRLNISIEKRLGHVPPLSKTLVQSRKPILLPAGTPTLRLKSVRRQAVATEAKSMLRFGAAGGHTMTINFASDASKVGYLVTMEQNRDTYAGAYKGWTANEDHHVITVPRDWRLRVQRRNLANLDGMLTLDAHPLVPEGDVQIYAATWARQGRGYDVQVDRGYIAVLGNEHFHADSAQAAIKGVRRKVKSAGTPTRSPVSSYALSIEAFVGRFSKRDLNVTVSDAVKTGSCDFGIRSWCESVGLDYSLGTATMAQVLDGFRMRPQMEVRRAVVFAVRRHRSECRYLAS